MLYLQKCTGKHPLVFHSKLPYVAMLASTATTYSQGSPGIENSSTGGEGRTAAREGRTATKNEIYIGDLEV